MIISLKSAGKRFNREWIFRNLNFSADFGEIISVSGPNGSGKSTLLQIICGYLTLSEGSITWKLPKFNQDYNTVAPYISLCASYVEMVEEMTANEMLDFHFSFKRRRQDITNSEILSQLNLTAAANQQLRYFSSGMKQRIKLAQAFFSDTPVILLDEPCTNLDTDGINIFNQLMESYTLNRLVLVASNDYREVSHCRKNIDISNFQNKVIT